MKPKQIAVKIKELNDLVHEETCSTNLLYDKKIVKELAKLDPYDIEHLKLIIELTVATNLLKSA